MNLKLIKIASVTGLVFALTACGTSERYRLEQEAKNKSEDPVVQTKRPGNADSAQIVATCDTQMNFGVLPEQASPISIEDLAAQRAVLDGKQGTYAIRDIIVYGAQTVVGKKPREAIVLSTASEAEVSGFTTSVDCLQNITEEEELTIDTNDTNNIFDLVSRKGSADLAISMLHIVSPGANENNLVKNVVLNTDRSAYPIDVVDYLVEANSVSKNPEDFASSAKIYKISDSQFQMRLLEDQKSKNTVVKIIVNYELIQEPIDATPDATKTESSKAEADKAEEVETEKAEEVETEKAEEVETEKAENVETEIAEEVETEKAEEVETEKAEEVETEKAEEAETEKAEEVETEKAEGEEGAEIAADATSGADTSDSEKDDTAEDQKTAGSEAPLEEASTVE